jgi:hypothetical protein
MIALCDDDGLFEEVRKKGSCLPSRLIETLPDLWLNALDLARGRHFLDRGRIPANAVTMPVSGSKISAVAPKPNANAAAAVTAESGEIAKHSSASRRR